MIEIPKSEKVNRNPGERKRIWIYGNPYSGKTYTAVAFPKPLIISTDGNYRFSDAPAVDIKSTVKGKLPNGQITMYSAWENFESVVDQLAKDSEFETIVVDLLEDIYEGCREYVLKKEGLTHESEGAYGKGWVMVRDEFFRVIKKLNNLPYDNIIYISHTASGSVPTKNGESATLSPNLSDKICNKISGLVDFTGVIRKDSEEVRVLMIKSNDFIFGGGRSKFMNCEVPLLLSEGKEPTPIYQAICDLYDGKIEPKATVSPGLAKKRTIKTATEKVEDDPKVTVAEPVAEVIPEPEPIVEPEPIPEPVVETPMVNTEPKMTPAQQEAVNSIIAKRKLVRRPTTGE